MAKKELTPEQQAARDLKMQQMDAAAKLAAAELAPNVKKWKASEIGAWWRKYYLAAGHKRLAYLLPGMAGASE